MQTSSDLLAIGKITGAHGIRGQVKVHLYAGDDSILRFLETVTIRCPDGRRFPLQVAQLHGAGRKTLLALKGYGSINDVQHLVGGELLVRRDELPATEDDEYYWTDLIGLTVVTESGLLLGTLNEIIETGSNDVYVVQGGEKEILIPALVDVVQNIDLETGTMTVAPPDGLLDL